MSVNKSRVKICNDYVEGYDINVSTAYYLKSGVDMTGRTRR